MSENINPTMTMAQIRQIESHPLSNLVDRSSKSPDRTPCYTYLTALCVQMVDFFGENWTDSQMRDVVRMLYENYYFLRSADWIYFSKKVKSLAFGKIYGKFTPAVIMDWAESFASDWREESINLSISGASRFKTIETDTRVCQEINKGLETAKNNFAKELYKNNELK